MRFHFTLCVFCPLVTVTGAGAVLLMTTTSTDRPVATWPALGIRRPRAEGMMPSAFGGLIDKKR